MSLIQRIARAWRRHSVGSFLRACVTTIRQEPREWLRRRQRSKGPGGGFDASFGGETEGQVEVGAFTLSDQQIRGTHRYQPSGLDVVDAFLAVLPPPHQNFEFLDIGSGKGRVVMLASRRGFRAAHGVEFEPTLHAIAVENRQRFTGRFPDACRIELWNQDARTFEFPNCPLAVFMYNPFGREIFEEVLTRLEAAGRQHGQPIYLMYEEPAFRDRVHSSGAWTVVHESSGRLFARMNVAATPGMASSSGG